MDYGTIVTTEFIPRCTAALDQIAAALVQAGLPPASVTVSMPDAPSQDLRFQIEARKGSRSFLAYIELSDGYHVSGEAHRGEAIFTFYAVDGNGNEFTHDYTPGPLSKYTDDTGLTALLAKLTELETKLPAVTVKLRAYLGL